MELKNAKLGQKYRLYIDDTNMVVGQPTKKYIVGTLIATYEEGYLFGWRLNEKAPVSRPRIGSILNPDFTYIPDQALYTQGVHIKTGFVVHSKVPEPGEPDGMACKKCRNFYHYAEPNQDDGTLVCYSCRQRW